MYTQDYFLVGRTDNGARVYVEITFDSGNLSITGEVIQRYCHNPSSAGQIIDELHFIDKPAGKLTFSDIGRLIKIWEQWHLNDMRAGCEHQRAMNWQHNIGARCPECGYAFGSKWLREEIPNDVLEDLEQIVERARDNGKYGKR